MNIRTKALIAVIIGNSIFGFSFLFSKIALQITMPSVLLALRFLTAFIVLNLIVFVGRAIKKKNGEKLIDFSLKGKPLKYALLLALFQPVIYFMAESYGIKYTSSAFAGTIIAVIPIMGLIFDVLIMHVKVSKKAGDMRSLFCCRCSHYDFRRRKHEIVGAWSFNIVCCSNSRSIVLRFQ